MNKYEKINKEWLAKSDSLRHELKQIPGPYKIYKRGLSRNITNGINTLVAVLPRNEGQSQDRLAEGICEILNYINLDE